MEVPACRQISVDQEPRLCRLLVEFEAITGVGVLPNTSLNVGGEPIIDSIDDLVAFLLTTRVSSAVVGSLVVHCRPEATERSSVVVPDDARLSAYRDGGRRAYRIERAGPSRQRREVSEDVFDALLNGDGARSRSTL